MRPSKFLALFFLVSAALIGTVLVQAGEPKKAAAKKVEKKGEKINPVQKEMRLLDAAMRDAVTAIAMGDVRSLPKKLHAVHIAAGDTYAELKSGAYKPPKGGDDVDGFITLDKAFHHEMIQMVKAAKKNDVNTTAKHFGGLIQHCNECHTRYR
ncbi:MAG: cytochrome c [Deltaproteobacteria bacterium]|nr:cytochrome c [Deltaproteobacteria bacterium]